MMKINLARNHQKIRISRASLLAAFLIKASLILGITAFLALRSEADQAREACLDRMEATLKDQTLQLDGAYRAMDPAAPQGIRPGNEPKLLRGRNRQALILVHGFLASPFEVTALGEEINKAGWTVYMPLIRGFGGSVGVANTATISDWTKTVTDAVDLVSSCYGHVSLAGFSLGGGLVTDFILNNPMVTTAGMYNETQIDSAILLSPYTKPKSKIMRSLVFVMADWLGFHDVDFSILDTLSFHDRDLQAVKKYPEHYNESFPIRAADKVMEMSRFFENLPGTIQSEVPLYLAYSKMDKTVDTEWGDEFLKKHFLSIKPLVFEKEENVPHQIQLPDDFANPNAEDLYLRTVKFLQGHTHGTDPKQDF